MKDSESWYWHNLNVATALILLVAMLARCYACAVLLACTGPVRESDRVSK